MNDMPLDSQPAPADLTQPHPYTVVMHRDVADAIDYSLSPMDGAIAIAQLYDQLPLLHRPARVRWWHKRASRYIRTYRGLIEWGCVGFTYVQGDSSLHVLAAWETAAASNKTFDTVLSMPDVEKYIESSMDCGGGVSLETVG